MEPTDLHPGEVSLTVVNIVGVEGNVCLLVEPTALATGFDFKSDFRCASGPVLILVGGVPNEELEPIGFLCVLVAGGYEVADHWGVVDDVVGDFLDACLDFHEILPGALCPDFGKSKTVVQGNSCPEKSHRSQRKLPARAVRA